MQRPLPLDTRQQRVHQRVFDVEITINPTVSGGRMPVMQLARRDQIARARRGIAQFAATVVCATPFVIEADAIALMHMLGEGGVTHRALMASKPPRPAHTANRAKSPAIML